MAYSEETEVAAAKALHSLMQHLSGPFPQDNLSLRTNSDVFPSVGLP